MTPYTTDAHVRDEPPQTGSFENPGAPSTGTLRNGSSEAEAELGLTALVSLRPPCSTVSGPVGSSRDLPASSASNGTAVAPGPTRTEGSADCHRHPSGCCTAPGDRNTGPPQAWTRPSAPPELHLRVFAYPGPAHPGPVPAPPIQVAVSALGLRLAHFQCLPHRSLHPRLAPEFQLLPRGPPGHLARWLQGLTPLAPQDCRCLSTQSCGLRAWRPISPNLGAA